MNFSDLPKQWLIRYEPGAQEIEIENFEGWRIQRASRVPILRLLGQDGRSVGRLIGWALDRDIFYRTDADVHLGPDDTPEKFFERISGRFVLLWKKADGSILLREDASGNLPAVFSADHAAVASTVTAMETQFPLDPDEEVDDVFRFPNQRGFLPFGLTARLGVRRLMPNHVLELSTMTARRVWPDASFCRRPKLSPLEVRAEVGRAGNIVKKNLSAILGQGETILYLSGGHDSRMILAAAIGLSGDLRCETLDEGGGLNLHIASKVAARLGVPWRPLKIDLSSSDDVAAWLRRTGFSVYDFVADVTGAMVKHAPTNHPLSGTGAELARATNWGSEDVDASSISLDRLLYQLRLPDRPVIQRAAKKWLDNIAPDADAAMVLDLAKIEQIHGCWSGAAIYGHNISLPTLHPFSGAELTRLVLSLPKDYRAKGLFFQDYMNSLAPDLLKIPVNRAAGLDRLMFWKDELRSAIPARIKRQIKPFR